MKTYKKAVFLAVTLLLGACSGSSSGHSDPTTVTGPVVDPGSDPGNGPGALPATPDDTDTTTNPDSGGDAVVGDTATMNGYSVSEDVSLNADLNGVWIESTVMNFTGEMYTDSGFAPITGDKDLLRSIFVIVTRSGEAYVSDCNDNATNILPGANTLAFDLGVNHYEFTIDSNTHMTGSVAFTVADDTGTTSGTGTSKIFKAMAGPGSQDYLLNSFSIGELTYSHGDAAEQQMAIKCFSDRHATITVQTEDSYVIESSETILTGAPGNYLTIHANSDTGAYLDLYNADDVISLTADESDETITTSASGTDSILFDVGALVRGSTTELDDLFIGTANLAF